MGTFRIGRALVCTDEYLTDDVAWHRKFYYVCERRRDVMVYIDNIFACISYYYYCYEFTRCCVKVLRVSLSSYYRTDMEISYSSCRGYYVSYVEGSDRCLYTIGSQRKNLEDFVDMLNKTDSSIDTLFKIGLGWGYYISRSLIKFVLNLRN